jgi:hypothetical protein
MKKRLVEISSVLIFLVCFSGVSSGADWANINGAVTYNGTPVCTMVLANGQYMFTCSGDGSFNLNVPLDAKGEITVFAFCSGLAPFRETIVPSQGRNMEIQMQKSSPGRGIEVEFTLQAVNSKRVRLAGALSFEGSPVCAMVLANGQYMFTCSGDGSFSLDVPLGTAGGVTLFAFCSGLPPYRVDYAGDEIRFDLDEDNDGYTIPEGDCNDLDPTVYPGALENCGDGIDQDCDGRDAPCLVHDTSPIATASGTYTYDGKSNLTCSFNRSTFPEGEGVPVNQTLRLRVVSVSQTTLVFYNDENERMTWYREGGQAGNLVGTWVNPEEDTQHRFVLNFEANGRVTLAAYFARFTVPYGSILIDGDYSDWKPGFRVYVDTDGPECNNLPGLDIREVYVAQDKTYIYLRFVLNGPLATTFGYKFGNGDRHTYVSWDGASARIIYASGTGYPPVNLPNSFVRVTGNQFECKFHKADVLLYWDNGYDLNAWLDQGRQTVCRDNVSLPILNFGN